MLAYSTVFPQHAMLATDGAATVQVTDAAGKIIARRNDLPAHS